MIGIKVSQRKLLFALETKGCCVQVYEAWGDLDQLMGIKQPAATTYDFETKYSCIGQGMMLRQKRSNHFVQPGRLSTYIFH